MVSGSRRATLAAAIIAALGALVIAFAPPMGMSGPLIEWSSKLAMPVFAITAIGHIAAQAIEHMRHEGRWREQVRDNELLFHDIDLMALVKKHGTPLRLTYLPKISSQIQRAKKWFADGIAETGYTGSYSYAYCTKSSHFRFVLDEALKTASAIAAMPPMAAVANKEMVNAAFETSLDQGLIIERRIFQILAASEDKAEGMAAFIEKREGVWKGR